jgi:hypothetical protein
MLVLICLSHSLHVQTPYVTLTGTIQGQPDSAVAKDVSSPNVWHASWLDLTVAQFHTPYNLQEVRGNTARIRTRISPHLSMNYDNAVRENYFDFSILFRHVTLNPVTRSKMAGAPH